MKFENLIGNEKVKDLLTKTIETNTILHSYLFVGIEGIGKSLFAKEFAKSILCIEENKPCDKCTSCMEIENSNHPDFMEIQPDGNAIKIEQIRFLHQKIAEKPIISKNKVYIINNADSMTKEAQNSLLKTLEEPPEYAVIILIASNESNLLNTIKSRCTKVVFQVIENEKIERYIKQNISEDVTKSMIDMCGGSIGKALRLKEGQEVYGEIEKLVQNLDTKDLIEIMNNTELFNKSKDNIYELLDYLNIILYNTRSIKKMNCIKIVEEAKKRLLSNSNFDMTIDNLLIKMWEEVNEKYNRS